MTEPARVEREDDVELTPDQVALLPRIQRGDTDALAEFLSLGLGTRVTIGPAVGSASDAATG